MKKYFLRFVVSCFVGVLLYVLMDFIFVTQVVKDIKINRYTTSPLTAQVEIYTLLPTTVSLRVKGKRGAKDIVQNFVEATNHHKIPVLGLYLNQTTEVELDVKWYFWTADFNLQLQSEYKGSVPEITVSKQTGEKNNYYYLDDGYVFDENGDIRFILAKPEDYIIYHINGELIAESRNRGIGRFDMLGQKTKYYNYPTGFTSFTHGLGVKPNGNILVIGGFANEFVTANGQKFPSHREFIIELDAATGHMVNTIDLAELLNPDRSVIVEAPAIEYGISDWCHINGVDYDQTDQSVIVSCRHFGMAKIDEKNNTLTWLITPKIGLEKSGRDGTKEAIFNKVLTAIDQENNILPDDYQIGKRGDQIFRWPTKNHHPTVVDGKYFGLFNNAREIYNKDIATTDKANALIYEVDNEQRTVKNVFYYQSDYMSDAGGAVTYLPDDNSVVVYISTAKQKDDDETEGVLYNIDFSSHDILFEAKVKRPGGGYFYKATPFNWYQEK